MLKQHNRIAALLDNKLLLDDAEMAALAGHPRDTCDYERESWEWLRWQQQYTRTLAVMERDAARRALTAGKLAECRDELDAKEPQRSWWQGVKDWFFGTRSK